MMSAPRTSSSGRPSANTLKTTSGSTWNDCGTPRPVNVKRPRCRRTGGERLALAAALLDEQLAQARLGDGRGGLHDEVRLPANGAVAGGAAPVAVREGEAGDRRARHQEAPEDPGLDAVTRLAATPSSSNA